MPKEISEQTKRVIKKAMQPRRKERYHSIEEFLDALGTENAQAVHVKNEKVQSEETLYMSTAIKEDSEPQEVERVQEKVSSQPLDVPKPKFLKEEDKEATMYITDYMVQESNIDTSDPNRLLDVGDGTYVKSSDLVSSEETADAKSVKEKVDDVLCHDDRVGINTLNVDKVLDWIIPESRYNELKQKLAEF